MTLRDAPPAVVRAAIEERDPLPGGQGFGGVIDEQLVRDVLGRQPVFLEAGFGSNRQSNTAEAEKSGTGDDRLGNQDAWEDSQDDGETQHTEASEDRRDWAFDPSELADPVPLPAGYALPLDALRGTEQERDPLAHASRLWSLPDPEPVDEEPGVDELRAALDAVLTDLPDVPVAFSGGVDSTVVATRTTAPLYVAGHPDSHDRAVATRAADRLDRELREIDLDPATIEAAVPTVAAAIGRTNPMDVAIALPLFVVARRVREDGFGRLALGQGADELFGGYVKVARAPEDDRVEATTVRGARRELLESLPEQLERDVRALSEAGVEPVTPLLDDRVVSAALQLPSSALVDETGQRKHALRLAARSFVPDAIAFREKKAVQYGSLVTRELDRLAREAGFKPRQDDHVTAYLEHRLETDS
jgi:asparagine synthase (glutamine-hydrolysing)